MGMFERAADAWKIQRVDERAEQEKEDRKLREKFSELLQKITGTSDFTVRGTGKQMSAEIEGIVFIPEMRLYGLIGSIPGVWMVTKGADGKRKTSGLIRTTGDLGREFECLVNDHLASFERSS